MRIKRTNHGLRYIPEYQIWLQMKGRCQNPNNKRYKYYGGRGITVCQEWAESFPKFLEDMGRRPYPQASIDRIDVNKGYCKENCRWADPITQAQNRTTAHYLTYKGKTLSMRQWAEETGLPLKRIKSRILNYHWSVEKTLETPDGIKANSRMITYHGKTMKMADWARELNLDYKTFKSRIRYGWTMDRIATTPVIRRSTTNLL